jgi:hypothetical protein
MVHTYRPPVSQLLHIGEAKVVKADDWLDYQDEFGVTAEHIPELLQLMQDEELLNLDPEAAEADFPVDLDPDQAMWAPLHAWRALGQLQAVQFVEGMFAVLTSEASDWAFEEFPQVCELIGAPAVEPLATLIQTHLLSSDEDMVVGGYVDCLEALAQKDPELRDRCVAILAANLENYQENPISTNSCLVSGLIKLQATEKVDLLETVFQARQVDEFFTGSWARVQIDLGLKTEADFTAAELRPQMTPELEEFRQLAEEYERLSKPNAYSLGLPIDWAAVPSSEPASFDDLMSDKSPQINQKEQKGFGGAQSGKKQQSGKKKKKK